MPIPIIDSHIHLFPETHLSTLAWHGPHNPLGAQHSIDEYRSAIQSVPLSPDENGASPYLRGFVFLETDRISSVEEAADGWRHALDELSFLTRIVLGEPVLREGHQPADRALCLGIVPWAPVPAGPGKLARYLSLAKQRSRTEEVWRKVRGVRYLVQDKPAGTMLAPGFIEGLKWLGQKKLAFDLGVDARQGGLWQLREAVEMMRRVYDGVSEEQRTVFVISEPSVYKIQYIQQN
jgi:L-rhamnono-1,4-lactonase